MYSSVARWLGTNQCRIVPEQEENQRMSRIANWVKTERDRQKKCKKIENNAGEEGDRECRHKIIPGYRFVLTIASPPMT
jgi:hypothetical protein